MTPLLFLAIAAAGGVGAVCRFVLDGLLTSLSEADFPWPTILINITGSLLLGLITGFAVSGLLPEAWRLVGPEDGGLPVTVTVVEELGSDAFVYGTSGVEGAPSNIIVRVSARDSVHKGDTIHVTTDPKSVHVFDADSGDRLSD